MKNKKTKNFSIAFVNAFDAYAGSQKVGAKVISVLQNIQGFDIKIFLGFGSYGFISETKPSNIFSKTNNIRQRKFFYIFWIIYFNFLSIKILLKNPKTIFWLNSSTSIPATLTILLTSPKNIVIHLHENNLNFIFNFLLLLYSKLGAAVICVSQFHASQISTRAQVIYNPVISKNATLNSDKRNCVLFVGSTLTLKGLDLFLEIAAQSRNIPLIFKIYLSGFPKKNDILLLNKAMALGIEIIYNETTPSNLFSDGWLYLQLTNPQLAQETFSLTTAEAIFFNIPVGGAGTRVIEEIAQTALAFNEESRDPEKISRFIRELYYNHDAYMKLVNSCHRLKDRFSEKTFENNVRDFIIDRSNVISK